MSGFTLRIDIGAPQPDVFDYIADGTRTPEWYEAVTRAEQIGDGPSEEGTRYWFTRELPQGRVTNEVQIAEYDKPRAVSFASRSGPTPFTYRYLVEPTSGGSTVTLEGSISGEGLRGPSAILAPFASKLFERGMAANLQALKTRLET